jgi:hypothetical protein
MASAEIFNGSQLIDVIGCVGMYASDHRLPYSSIGTALDIISIIDA